MGRRALYSWLCIAGLTTLCVGCGPVDLKKLKPTVWKPTAYVMVDGQVPGWTPGLAERIASSAGVVTKAVYTPPTNLVPRLIHVSSAMPRVGLFVVASSGQMPIAVANWAKSHPNARLEWVGGGSAAGKLSNVRQLTMNQTTVSYLLGWLAAEEATIGGNGTVGWDLLSPSASAGKLKAALGGSFAANSGVSNVPDSITIASPGQVSSTSSSSPKWIVVNYDLDPSEWAAAEASSIRVVSLVSQTLSSPALAAEPGYPDASSMVPDLASFAARKWRGGTGGTANGSWVQFGSSVNLASISRLLSAQESIVTSDPSLPESVFASLPQTVQQAWLSSLSIG